MVFQCSQGRQGCQISNCSSQQGRTTTGAFSNSVQSIHKCQHCPSKLIYPGQLKNDMVRITFWLFWNTKCRLFFCCLNNKYYLYFFQFKPLLCCHDFIVLYNLRPKCIVCPLACLVCALIQCLMYLAF